MLGALRAHVERVSVVAPLPLKPALRDTLAKARHRLHGRGFHRHHTEAVAKGYARHAEPLIRQLAPDVVLSPGSIPCAYLDAGCPVAFWPDATFESNLYYYGDYTGLADENVLAGHRIEQAALDRAGLALYASEYAAASAIGFYGADPAKVHLVPYGANFAEPPSREDVEAAVAARPADRCRLLFVGGDWFRKGGDVAVRVAEEMTRRGLPTELVVVGTVPLLWRESPCVRAVGFLRKDDPAERAQLVDLFASSHFFCLPVRAENYGCVFAEASAFGLPALTMATGGATTSVTDGENGFVFPARSAPQTVAERAVEALRDRPGYEALCRSARTRFERVQNWDVATGTVARLLSGLVG